MRWLLVMVLAGVLVMAPTVIPERPRSGVKLGPDAPEHGVLDADPFVLATQHAGVHVDVYTAARIVESEAGDAAADAERIAVVWVARNEVARRLGRPPGFEEFTRVVCAGEPGEAGRYGAQDAGGRWISTRRAPERDDVDLAVAIFAGEIPDNTGGATKFFHVATQDALHRRDPGRYRSSADVISKWTREGYEPRTVGSVPASRFLVFVRSGGVS
jgi:hypothetical protein